jgi:excisionase family DNA binding protein
MTAVRHFCTIREVAEMLALKPKSCYSLAARGILPIVKLGRVLRVDVTALDKIFDDQLRRQSGETR